MTSNKSITLLKDVEPFKSCWCVQMKRFQDPLFMQEVMIYRKEKHRSMLEELEALPILTV
ncbi:hypothetical protein IGI04_030082 [Brassica rapa subsp. trilocularis]|uniref:Uncharacterized protein n=1 Tax=Brassica rapa subsp. trilocularis TaxID=1813537 RepID=A0ABQ7LS03_BRACM|nr:hypothetical protein IGI04_030082 [Brassica rapa subsp. trilocularis]